MRAPWYRPPAAEKLAIREAVLPPGGAAGQVLAKASDADFDLAWVDPSSGDGGGAPAPDPDTPNDTFANAWPVTIATPGGTYTSEAVNLTGFGRETGESGGGSRTAWWTYTPTTSGEAVLDTELSPGGPDTIINVFTGSAVGSLAYVGGDDDSGIGVTSRYTLAATANTTYRIQVSASTDVSVVLRAQGPATA